MTADGTITTSSVVTPGSSPTPGSPAIAARRGWHRRTDGVAVAVGIVVCLLLSGWFHLDRSQPLTFVGDHLVTLGRAKAYVDGHGSRWNDHLGYPGVRDALYHPTFYFAQMSVLRAAARRTGSAPAAVAWFYGVGLGALFAAAYWALRRLAIGWRWAWLGALAFAVSPYVATRSGLHDMLAPCFSVPLGVVLALWPALQQPGDSSRRARWIEPLVLALVIGASGMYYAFFTGLFAGLVALVLAWRERTPRPILMAAAPVAIIVVTMLITGPGAGLIDVLRGDVSLPRRGPDEQVLYGLVIADAARVLGMLPGAPEAWRQPLAGTSGEGAWGEWPGVLLSAVILLAPFTVIAATRAADAGRRLAGLCRLCITAGLLFAVRGGLGLWFNTAVTPAIRAQNRVMPFLTFFALILLLTWAENRRRDGRRVATSLAALGLALGTWPAIGHLHATQARFLADPSEQEDRASIEALLSRAHASGLSRVLQLPVVRWPEADLIGEFTPYRLELPYLLDTHARPLRWSYGLSDRQPAFGYLSTVIHRHMDHELAAAAAALGFDAVYVEHAAFPRDRLPALLASLETQLDPGCRVFADARRSLFALTRIGETPCVRGDVTLDTLRYVTSASGHGRPLLLGGWSDAEPDFTWSDGREARVLVPLSPRLASERAVDVTLTFSVYQPPPPRDRTIEIRSGDVVRQVVVKPGDPGLSHVTVTVQPDRSRSDGSVELVIRTPDAERPSDHGSSDPRLLGIALREIAVTAHRPVDHPADQYDDQARAGGSQPIMPLFPTHRRRP